MIANIRSQRRLPVGSLGIAFAALGIFCAAPVARAETLGAKAAPVASVTVYEDRALVTRRFSLHVPKGMSSHELEGLTPALDTASLRATIEEAGPRVKVIGVTARRDAGRPSDEDVRAARRKVEAVQDRMEALRHKMAVLDEVGRYLTGYAEHARKGLSVRTTEEVAGEGAKPWNDTLDFLAREETRRVAERRVLDQEIERARQDLASAGAELAKLEGGAGRESTAAILAFDSENEAEVKVALAYLVGGASWQAAYDARLEEGKKEVEMDYLGRIRQSTGEDWEKVALTLSNARPSLGARVPEIVPLEGMLAAREEAKIRSLQSAAQETEKQAGEVANLAPVAAGAETTVERKGPSLVFAIRQPASIPADGSDHQVLITEAKLKSDLAYETVPRLMELVYLKADLTNTLPNPILPGEVRVTRAGSFIGVSHLENIAPSETFPLFLGVDRDIQVIRQVRRERDVKEALLGRGKTFGYGYTIKLKSFKTGGTTVRVREGIPVSEVKDVKVRFLPDTTPGYELDKDGIVAWTLTLERGVEAKVDLGYEVEVPGNFDWQ